MIPRFICKLQDNFFLQDKSFAEIAKAEMWEECGYEVALDQLVEVQTFPASVGTRCEPMIMFYTEVTFGTFKNDYLTLGAVH